MHFDVSGKGHSSSSGMAKLCFQIMANMIVFVPLCTGLLLLWVSFCRRVRGQGGESKHADSLKGVHCPTGIPDLAEHFDDYRLGRHNP